MNTGNHIYNNSVLYDISESVHLHSELNNPKSSAAACINVLGNLKYDKNNLREFLNSFDLNIEEILDFPKGVDIGGEIYDDVGPVIFEWIGPKSSPINEIGGTRGQRRTSVDAFLIVKIDGMNTQILIEWKYTESYNGEHLRKFSGIEGNERLRRYSSVLAELRKRKDIPFRLDNEKYKNSIGLYYFGYEPFYQLMRFTLLAKMTTPIQIGEYKIEDYRIVHLTHSKDDNLNILSDNHIQYTPSIDISKENSLHKIWKNQLLIEKESQKFKYGFWDKSLNLIKDVNLKTYLIENYNHL